MRTRSGQRSSSSSGKYAPRFGKKDGKNEKDLYKVIHYAIILLGAMHEEELKNLNDYHLELNDGS